MSNTDTQAPAEVVQAVEALERATSPADLGPAYRTVLDWRQRWPRRTFGLRLYQVGIGILFLAIIWLLNSTDLVISEYWRGFAFGASLVVLLTAIREWSSRRSQITMTFVERVDEAIDRWRHAVPAMRDFPR